MLTFCLTAPAEACTASSILLLWNKPANAAHVKEYHILMNDMLLDTCTATDYTVRNLHPDTTYSFAVTEILTDGSKGWQTDLITITTNASGKVINVLDYSAKGNGQTLNTPALQAAIDACPAGGTVLIPAGTYRTGALFLHSNMTLHLTEGATLLASEDVKDFPVIPGQFEGKKTPMYASLINATPAQNGYVEGTTRLHDVRITGHGTLCASGKALFQQELRDKSIARGRALFIANTDRVYIEGVTIRESPAWCLHLLYCTHATINDIQLHSKYMTDGSVIGIYNGDGIDPESCLDVNIVNCTINSQDDCIALKSGRDAEGRAVGKPTERVRITNCRFYNGFGVAVGSEMSGGIRDVLVQDCTFTDSFSVGSIKAPRGRGNVVENVLYDTCTLINHNEEHHDCKWFRGGINVDMFYSVEDIDYNTPHPMDEGTPTFRNITFQNIDLETVGGNAIYISGLPESHIEKLILRNIHAKGKSGMHIHNVKDLVIESVSVELLSN